MQMMKQVAPRLAASSWHFKIRAHQLLTMQRRFRLLQGTCHCLRNDSQFRSTKHAGTN